MPTPQIQLCEFTRNRCMVGPASDSTQYGGGGLFLGARHSQPQEFMVARNSFTQNACDNGGGIYATLVAVLRISGSAFTSNEVRVVAADDGCARWGLAGPGPCSSPAKTFPLAS